MRDFGTVRPGTTLYIPFATYDSNDPSASVTLTGLATSDIEIYKDGSVTQRSSDAGYTLLDTDGIDFDGVTGIHGFSISLADNTDAGFYAAGSQYTVVVASVTVDAATVNFIAATFRIGYPDAVLNTTIASLSTQTSFTLTVGPAEDDALNGAVCVIHDVASAVQLGFAVVSDYTGASKTVTLTAGVTFTAAATDNISFYAPVNTRWFAALAAVALPLTPTTAGRTLDVSAGGEAGVDWANVGTPGSTVSLSATTVATVTTTTTAINVTTVNGLAANVITAASMNADASAEIADSVWDEALSGHQTAGTAGRALRIAGAILGEFSINDASATTTSFVTTLSSAVDDFYKDDQIVFTSGALAGQARIISDYVGATKTVTLDEALTSAPADTVTFIVRSVHAHTIADYADAIWDEPTAGHVTSGTFGEQCKTDIDAILTDTAEIGAAGAGLTNINLPDQTMNITGNITGNLSGSVGSVTGAVGSVSGLTASDVGAIKTKTDSLTFTQAGHVDANIQRINDVAITGDGQVGTEFSV